MKNSTRKVHVAVIQHPPVYLNLEASVEKACTLIGEAAKDGASIVAFPETWLPGYPVWIDSAPEAGIWGNEAASGLYIRLVKNSLTIPGEAFASLVEVASTCGIHLVMGAHELFGSSLYNTMFFISPQGEFRIHRKLTPTYTERLVWGMGDGSTLSVMDTEFGVLGGLICWEHWLPLARAAVHAKKEVIHVSQWPWVRDLHQVASRHYAFEGQCFVLAAGTVLSIGDVLEGYESLPGGNKREKELLASMGDPAQLLQNGGSAVIAPDSSYVAEPLFGKNGIIHAVVNLDLVTEGHLLMDSDGHYSRPDVFSLTVNAAPACNVKFVQ